MVNVHIEHKERPINLGLNPLLMPSPHLHKEIELIYVKKGSVECYVDRQCHTLTTGDVFISFPNQVHYYLNCDLGEYYCYIISADLFWGMNKLLYNNRPTVNALCGYQDTPIAALFAAVMEQKGEHSETMQVGLLTQLICLIVEELTLKPQLKSDKVTIQSILNHCAQHFSEDVTLEDVAAALHLNKYHISHLLNNKLGISFNTYINTLRIDKACVLLTTDRQTVAEISAEVGFGSIRSFNRAFAQIMHMTPLEYRRRFTPKSRGEQTTRGNYT